MIKGENVCLAVLLRHLIPQHQRNHCQRAEDGGRERESGGRGRGKVLGIFVYNFQLLPIAEIYRNSDQRAHSLAQSRATRQGTQHATTSTGPTTPIPWPCQWAFSRRRAHYQHPIRRAANDDCLAVTHPGRDTFKG